VKTVKQRCSSNTIQFAAKSWRMMQASTIANCFKKAGIQRCGTNNTTIQQRRQSIVFNGYYFLSPGWPILKDFNWLLSPLL
jgi:hypothetical protein